jgi:hypothetical protein
VDALLEELEPLLQSYEAKKADSDRRLEDQTAKELPS